MKGIINEDGVLVICRKEKWVKQLCPFIAGQFYCGEWCPFFSEPEEKDGKVYLELCRKTLIFDEFKDRRK